MFPKSPRLKSESYRRWVASQPCIACGVHGYSQAAHPSTGRGGAMKTDDDRCFPLCCDRVGVRGCHSFFDQGGMFSKSDRRAVEQRWAEETRRQAAKEGIR